jgi:hypothetical protein
MYSRQEAAQLRQEFWTAFGQYMAPVLSSEGERVNWVNYKTGVKNIAFRMEAGNRKNRIGVEISHKDQGLRQLFFDQLAEFKNLLVEETGEEWRWEPFFTDDHGRITGRVFIELNDGSIFRKEDWPLLISFFKQRIIALDAFWNQVKYGFESLR